MPKNHRSKQHYRNIANGNSNRGAHAKPAPIRYNPRMHPKKGLRQSFGKLGAMALLGAASLGAVGCDGKSPENYDLIEIGTIKKAGSSYLWLKEENLEDGYALPQNMNFEIRDQNQNRKRELVLEYKGQRYLVKYNSTSNRVSLVPYEKNIQLNEVQ